MPVFPFYRVLSGPGNEATRKNFCGMTARAEAYCPFEALLSDRKFVKTERGACRVVRLAIKGGVRRRSMRNAPDCSRKAQVNPLLRRISVRSARPCALDLRALPRLHPPSDEYPDVVASGARAVCADRATFRGSPRRSTKAQLPSSFVMRLNLNEDGIGRASIVPVWHGRHFLLVTRAGITVALALGLMGKQWHTR